MIKGMTQINTPSPFELEPSWMDALQEELKKPYLLQLAAFIEKERSGKIPIYPPREQVFNALKETPFDKTRVVIVGQDPYHGPGQAHGLCFSVPKGVTLPPSLLNIFKELRDDLGYNISANGCLSSWAQQGVLLLNATLTVRQGEPMSHHGQGWELFTDAIIQTLLTKSEPLIFVLWGKSAQDKCIHMIESKHKAHTVLIAPHPSPLSARTGFFGSRPFSKINALRIQHGEPPIDWSLDLT